MKRQISRVALASLVGVLGLFSSSGLANLTPIVSNPFGQPEPKDIISHIYNDSVTSAGANFNGSSITATRLDDSAPSPLVGQTFVANAVAKFSANTQIYGVLNGTSFTPAFTATGIDYNVTGSGTISVHSGESFGRAGNTPTDSSVPSQNPDGRDHAITYRISGANPDPQYLQFWEDLSTTQDLSKGRTKSDFNDLVVQLEPTVGSGGNSVPLPQAAASGAMMLGALLVCKRKSTAGRARAVRAHLSAFEPGSGFSQSF